ncbi:MAG: 3'(2'),5'-bisphosphate nucleotidase CysQ [Alphaproteobacteria bacterium]
MNRFGTGQTLRRVEDRRFLSGRGRYTEDFQATNQATAVVVRSMYAHARILKIDAEVARRAPGVLGVFTLADLEEEGIDGLPCKFQLPGMPTPPRPVLAGERVRYVGEPVAFVVADTLTQAQDAAELVEVSYQPLAAVPDLTSATEPGVSVLYDNVPGNLLFDWSMGDAAAVTRAFAQAARVVTLDLVNNRLAPNTLETRSAIGAYDAKDDLLTLTTGNQGSHTLKEMLCQDVLHLPEDRLRVVAPDVGGGFGMRLFLYPEMVLVLFAARRLKRPVKWVADRSEAFLTDTHGRDHLSHAELALAEDGRFLALKVETMANLGAALSQYAAYIPTFGGSSLLTGAYAIDALQVNVRGVVTNTAPVDAYRGAGRPEAAYLLERLVDKAAREMGMEPWEIRRRNFVPSSAMPYRNAGKRTYDSGDFAGNLEKALQRADTEAFSVRKRVSAAVGRWRGLGIAYYLEVCGGSDDERAEIVLDANGRATVLIGTQSTGQGHETAYAQMVSASLGLGMDYITVVQGDTGRVASGNGTGASRSLSSGGGAVMAAVEAVIDAGRERIAALWGMPLSAIHFADGQFHGSTGSDIRSLPLTGVAEMATSSGEALRGAATFTPKASTYPNGCHISELEIDPETGEVDLMRHTIVDDVGVVLNPLLVEGQIVGGAVQGIGQALFENVVYDRESGQLLTGTLMDYALPRADRLPVFDFSYNEIPCRTHPLGVKGAGEAGTIGATPAVINAVIDALAPLGITHLDMPATPLRVWQAIQAATVDRPGLTPRALLLLPAVRALARAAGREILRIYGEDFAVVSKPDDSPVTQADEMAEAVILKGLAELTPGIPVVAEESFAREGQQDISGGIFWLVDPLDGTREFVKRNGEFTVNIALIVGGEPVLGVVYAPVLDHLYHAAGVGTATVERDGQTRPIRVRTPPPEGLTVMESRSHGNPAATEVYLKNHPVRSRTVAGSSLKFCLVAAGEADLYPRLGRTMEWDTAAGHAVVLGAGGRVLTLDGQPLHYGKPGLENPHFIVKGPERACP